MRILLIPIMALACMGASDEAPIETPQPGLPGPSGDLSESHKNLLKGEPAPRFEANSQALQALLGRKCRDRLENAQEEGPALQLHSVPLFRRDAATPEKPLAIYAVDRREDGCGVLVMMGNPDDVRPVPSLDADDHRLMPAEGEE